MKKIYYLIAMAMMAFTFTSCEDVPEPFGQPINPNQPEETIDPAGTGTATDPFNVAGIIDYVKGLGADVVSPNDVYVSGIITEVTAAFVNDNYGNATFRIGDTENSKTTFYAYRCLYFGKAKYTDPTATNIKVGDKVVICGKVINYKGTTPETQQNDAYVVSINGQGGGESGGGESGGGESGGGETGKNLLANGDFEAWSGSTPDNWNGVTGNGTFEKSTTVHGGSAALLFKGSSSANKRLAYKEIKLKAGTYTLTAYAKAATETKASLRPGYAKLTNGAVADSQNDYKYGNYTNDITNADWATVSHSFTLTEETSLNILFMNPKSTAADVILDDVTLTTSDGGIIDGGETGGGESGGGDTGSDILNVSFASGQGDFTIEDKELGSLTYVWKADTKGYMKASAFVNNANNAAESWLISPAFSLKNATAPVMTFNNACNYVKEGTITDHIKVMVYDGTNWTEATIASLPDGASWTFVDSTVDLKAFAGKENVKVAFKYVSTTAVAPTWEIKTVTIK
jgi:hypothetical protein